MDELIINNEDNNEAPDSPIQQQMKGDTAINHFLSSPHSLQITPLLKRRKEQNRNGIELLFDFHTSTPLLSNIHEQNNINNHL